MSGESDKPMKKVVIEDLTAVSRRDLMKTLGPAAALGMAGLTSPGVTGTASAASQETPTTGGTLRTGMKVGVETMDGRSVTGLQSFQIFYNIYSKLLRWEVADDELRLVGDLATEWEWEDDTTFVVSLNEDAVFHNGEPVTADDVVHTFTTMFERPEFTAALLFPREISVEARDEHTAVFDTGERPLASLEPTLGFIVGIINETADMEGDMSTNPIGSGPFAFEEWVDGDHVYVNRFEDYWKTDDEGTQLPYLDRIEFNIFPDVGVKLTSLREEQLDWIDLVPRKDVESVRNDDSLVTAESGLGAFMGIMQLNTLAPPFSDVNVRKAVLHAIDWQPVLDIAFSNVAERAPNNPMPPSTEWDFGVEDPFQGQDLEAANEFIEQAEEDHTVAFTNPVTRGDRVRVTMQEVIQQQLQQNLDMNPEIRLAEGSTVFELLSNGEFGYSVSGFNGMFDPDQIFSANLIDGAFFNYGNFVNTEIQELLVEARTTTDRDERTELYGQVQQLYTDEAGKYFPYWDNAVQAMQPTVRNYRPLLDQEWWFESVWKEA